MTKLPSLEKRKLALNPKSKKRRDYRDVDESSDSNDMGFRLKKPDICNVLFAKPASSSQGFQCHKNLEAKNDQLKLPSLHDQTADYNSGCKNRTPETKTTNKAPLKSSPTGLAVPEASYGFQEDLHDLSPNFVLQADFFEDDLESDEEKELDKEPTVPFTQKTNPTSETERAAWKSGSSSPKGSALDQGNGGYASPKTPFLPAKSALAHSTPLSNMKRKSFCFSSAKTKSSTTSSDSSSKWNAPSVDDGVYFFFFTLYIYTCNCIIMLFVLFYLRVVCKLSNYFVCTCNY
jgi:hypothetical protein